MRRSWHSGTGRRQDPRGCSEHFQSLQHCTPFLMQTTWNFFVHGPCYSWQPICRGDVGGSVPVPNLCQFFKFFFAFYFFVGGSFRLCRSRDVPPTCYINLTNSCATSPSMASTPLSPHVLDFLPAVLVCRVFSSETHSSCFGCEFNSGAYECAFSNVACMYLNHNSLLVLCTVFLTR